MRRRSILQVTSGVALAFALALSALTVRAQSPPISRMPMYNTATEVNVKGTVEEVDQLTGRRGWAGTHLQLKTDQGTLDVDLGPSWFLANNNIVFAKGDQIEVTGSKVKFGDKDALLAREVTKSDKKIALRNDKGFPLWSRGPHR